MTTAEHALENAVYAMRQGKSRSEWASIDLNLERLGATAEEIWDMAAWVLYSWCGDCLEQPAPEEEEEEA